MKMEGRVRHIETGQVGIVVNSGGKLALILWDGTTSATLVYTDKLEKE